MPSNPAIQIRLSKLQDEMGCFDEILERRKMTNEEAKKIFHFYKENCSGWSCTSRDLYVGFHYFEKSNELVLEHITRLSRWKNDIARYVARANYTTLTINKDELKEVLEKMSEHEKEKLEKQESLF